VETLYRAGLNNAVSATIIALLVACLGRLLARRPAILHSLWLLVLVKLVTPPLYEVAVPWTELVGWPGASAPDVELCALVEEHQAAADCLALPLASRLAEGDWGGGTLELDADPHGDSVAGENRTKPVAPGSFSSADWMKAACLIWIAGTLTSLAISGVRIRRFQQLLCDARRAGDETQEWVDELAVNIGLSRAPLVYWVDCKLSPLVWSLGWRPRLVIPRGLWKGLDDRERATLIVHELAHLRRGDHHLRIFELLVTALYWWHPVVWWARQSLRDVEEQCCDAWVVWAFPDAAKSYAETLLETLDFLNRSELSEPLLASGFGKVHHLRKRLIMIMSGTTPRLVGLWGTLGSLGLAAALLPVNATWAQKPEDKKEATIIVNADDAVAESSAAIALIDGDGLKVVTDLDIAVAETKPEEVRVNVTVDDSSDEIVAASLKQAIGRIKDRIKEIDKAASPSEQQKARKQALERVVKELESAAKTTKNLATADDKQKVEKEIRRIIVRRAEENKELTATQKAEIDAARAKIVELAASLKVKQKELAEARAKLSKLVSGAHSGQVVIARVKPQSVKPLGVLTKLPEVQTISPGQIERRVIVDRKAEADQKRLEHLEQKLDELLKEVATLKKDRAR
jgi:beta-lactamase regulating signal transducer with metallopeptidase domain